MRYTVIWTYDTILDDTFDLANECSKYTDKVILLIDKEQDTRWFEFFMCENKWRDMGKLYQRLQKNQLTEEDELCFTNNTISPIGSFKDLFKFCQDKRYDFTWATSAYTNNKLQVIVNGRHIQSFFLYFKWKSILSLQDFVKTQWIYDDKRDVVEQYELWISNYMKILWYKCRAYIEADYMIKKYKHVRYDPIVFIKNQQKIIEYQENWEWNGTFAYPELYLQEWLPFVKNTMLKYGFTCPIIQVLSSKLYNQWPRKKPKT